MIFGINTTSNISKLLLYEISQAFRRVKFETILKYHKWYLWQISRTNQAIICLYNYPQKVVIYTCRYFKLSWNTTALGQSNCRNFSCSSIINVIQVPVQSWAYVDASIQYCAFSVRCLKLKKAESRLKTGEIRPEMKRVIFRCDKYSPSKLLVFIVKIICN